MNKTEEAKSYGISKQAYNYRLKNWVKVKINGKDALINPNAVMYLKKVI